MIPYLASHEWYDAFLHDMNPAPPKGRWNRSSLYGADGEQMLTVPVQGGISVIKRHAPESWLVADAKNWRHTHIGALRAAYGRAPFYMHYGPQMESIIADRSCDSLAEISLRLHRTMLDALAPGEFRRALAADPDAFRRCVAYSRDLSGALPPPHVAMVHTLFHLGPDAIFTLPAAFHHITDY